MSEWSATRFGSPLQATNCSMCRSLVDSIPADEGHVMSRAGPAYGLSHHLVPCLVRTREPDWPLI